MGVALPDPEFRILRAQREDPRVAVHVIGVDRDGLHVCADGLRALLERDMGVPFPFPQILRLRVDLQREVVIAEGVGRAASGHEDLGLEPEGARAAPVQGERLVRGGLGRLEPAHPQETIADGREGFRKVLEPRGRLPHFEEAEGFDERDRRAGFGSRVQCGDA